VTSTFSAAPTDAPFSRQDEWGNPTRNFEGYSCDARGYGRGYGVVLDDGTADAPYQFKSDVGGFPLNGAFTLWIRRPVRWTADPTPGNTSNADWETQTLEDYAGDDALILVSEGVAPYRGGGATSALGASNRSTAIIEVLLTKGTLNNTVTNTCTVRQGQAGNNAQGTNSGGCTAMTGGSDVTTALVGVAGAGTGNLK
jgi:hypothetical protein